MRTRTTIVCSCVLLAIFAVPRLAHGLSDDNPAQADPAGQAGPATQPSQEAGGETVANPPRLSTGFPGAPADITTRLPSPPPELSAGRNLRILHWTTFRKITQFQRGEGVQFISDVKMNRDGSRIYFSSQKGTFIINPDGSGMAQISFKPASVIALSADGKKIAWFEGGGDGLFVANSDGGNRTRIPGGFNIIGMRLTADGSNLFVLCPEKGGIFAMRSDGSEQTKIIDTADACKVLGIDENGNHWRAFDISDDGSRMAGYMLNSAFTANGDGSNLRCISDPKPEPWLEGICISADGREVVQYRKSGEKTAYVFSDFGGGNVVPFLRPNDEMASMQLSPDGQTLALSWGVRFCRNDGKTYYDAMDTGTSGWAHPYHLTMTGDMKRGCFQIDGQESTDQGRPSQLVIVDFDPPSLNGAPDLREVSASPRFLLDDDSKNVTLSARSDARDLQTLGAAFFRDGARLRTTNYFGLNDSGSGGDQKAGDGVFTNNAVNAHAYDGKPLSEGAVMLRVHAQRKDFGDLTVVDLEGLEVRPVAK